MHEEASNIVNNITNTNDVIQFEPINSTQCYSDIHLGHLMQNKILLNQRFISMEISPPPTVKPLDYNDFAIVPLFTAITWMMNLTNTNDFNSFAPIRVTKSLSHITPHLMHLSCMGMTEEYVDAVFETGVRNFLAVRGDKVLPDQKMQHAYELVEMLRRKFGNAISIGVGGYPEGHPEAISLDADLFYLKEKVDAGADFVITQVCFDAEKVLQFIRKCREIGIKVPIIPGVFVPINYRSLMVMTRVCQVKVPENLFLQYKLLKRDVAAFQKFAIGKAFEFISELYNDPQTAVYGVHFFSLNAFETIIEVWKRLRDENVLQ